MSRYHRHTHSKKRRVLVVKQQAKFKLVDRLTYIVAIVEPLVTVPQAYTMYRDKTAAGVSITTWVGYELLTLVWLWYGIAHKERVIITYQVLWLIVQSVIILEAIKYGASW